MSPTSWPAGWSEVIAPPGSSVVGLRRCWQPWRRSSNSMTSPARSHWRTTWRAASVRASVALCRFARLTVRPTSAECASKDRSSPPIWSTGRGWFIDPLVTATGMDAEADGIPVRITGARASELGSDREAWRLARSPRWRQPRRVVHAGSFPQQTSCEYPAHRDEADRPVCG